MENTTGNSYNLSIRINSDGFSLSVFDESESLISTQHVSAALFTLSSDEIVRILSAETQLNYQNIKLICESDKYIFIPTPIFTPEEATDFLTFQHKKEKNERVVCNTIPAWETVNSFTIPATLEQALSRLFPGASIEHQISWLLTNKIKPQLGNSVSIWVRQKKMDIIALKESKLQLMNSFNYQTPEDFTYHALNIIEQLSLDIEKCKVFIYNAEKKPELKMLLEKYVTTENSY
jgi:hypothetical protein